MPKQNSSVLFNRYIWLVELIYSVGHISREEIDRRWSRSSLNYDHETQIPERTFHRYKEAIQELFQIEIAFSKSSGYYIRNTSDIQRDQLRQWLISTFAAEKLLSECTQLRSRIVLEDIPSGKEYLTPVIEAMRDSVKIQFTHRSFYRNTPSEVLLAPYCVRIFRQRWYVLGKPENLDDLRIYALDRVLSLERTAESFVMPTDFDAECYFADRYGVSMGKHTPELVRIRVDAMQSCYFRSLPIHSSQEEIERNEDYSVFRFFLVPTFEFNQQILSYGAAIEVLSPKWLREQMRQEFIMLNKIYSEENEE